MVAHASNPIAQGIEAGGLRIQGKPGLQKETLAEK
jgi:hypothetical protein